MKPIYKPKGAAGEYADLALNIYTGCPHGCDYCYAPGVLRKTREDFTKDATVRSGLIDALKNQLEGGEYSGKTIFLCFTCDPYPSFVDQNPTHEVIRMLKDAGCHIQLLTKNPDFSERDWRLLDGDDWIGVTYSGCDYREPHTCPQKARLLWLRRAKQYGFRTWVSCEPVLDAEAIYSLITTGDYIDLFKIGKLNYHPSNLDWREFGFKAKNILDAYGRKYVLKESLLKEMGDA